MSAWDLSFDPLAFREFVRASNWYRDQSPRAADRFIDAVDRAVERICANPLQWPAFRTRFRWVRVRKFR
jgi:plasmid stabilization system protein ParE